jgi:hypothetical protein
VLCSEDGNMALWPDFCASDALLTQRISGTVTALAAAALPEMPGAFMACAATADGSLHSVIAGPDEHRRLRSSAHRFAAASPQGAQQAC